MLTANRSRIVLGSAIIFTLAFATTTILHELAHALTALALGTHPVLHDTHVVHTGATAAGNALTAGAGPLFSFLQGMVLFMVFRKIKYAPPLAQLFALWMALHGLVNFFGYLITVVLAPHADIGQVAAYLGLGRPVQFGIMTMGGAGIVAIGILAAKPFLWLAPSADLVATPQARSAYIVRIGIIPWVLGALAIALIRYPWPFLITLIYPGVSGAFAMVSRRRAARLSDAHILGVDWHESALWPWLLALVVVLLFSRFVLAPGIRLGLT